MSNVSRNDCVDRVQADPSGLPDRPDRHIRSLAVNRAKGGNVLPIKVLYRVGTIAYPRPAAWAFVLRAVSP